MSPITDACVIFDIDGTLVDTVADDARLYGAAVREVLGDVSIYVGDGEWDKRASELLGWRFIGVGGRLRGSCPHWLADFSAPNLLQILLG